MFANFVAFFNRFHDDICSFTTRNVQYALLSLSY